MRILYDARHIIYPYSGLGRYTGALLRTLLRLKPEDYHVDILLHHDERWNGNEHFNDIKKQINGTKSTIIWTEYPPFSLKQHLGIHRSINHSYYQFYFYPHFDLPLLINIPSIFVVHDLLPLLIPDYVQTNRILKKLYFKYLIEHSLKRPKARCVAVSNTTKKDIIHYISKNGSEKIDVVYEGMGLIPVDSEFAREENDLIPEQENYLLYVGDWRPHKQLKKILDIFIILKSKYKYSGKMYIIGSDKVFNMDFKRLYGDCADIRFKGNLSDAQLRNYYKNTDALIMLSEYEGFGLPVVEAASFSRPVIVSDGGSLAEIAPQWACIIPNKMEIEEAANKINQYLHNKIDINSRPYLEKFNWENAVRKIFFEIPAKFLE